jgi:hypothetical protein
LAQSSKDNRDNLKRLRPGQKIEVVDMKLKSFKANFESCSEDGVSPRMGDSSLAIERRNVLRVSLREHSKRARHALIGAAIGAGGYGCAGRRITCRLANDLPGIVAAPGRNADSARSLFPQVSFCLSGVGGENRP